MSHVFNQVGHRKLLSKVVENQIEEAIRSKILRPGSRLPSENELCEQFGVSRTAIREALRMLNARGLISIEKGRGMFVQNFSAETVTDPLHLYLKLQCEEDYALDIVHARQIIEPPIAASAAVNHTDEDARMLVQDFDELKQCSGNYEDLSRLDMRFHLNIARASENVIVPLLLEPIHRLMPQIKSSVYASVKNAQESAVEWHGKILERILARDAEGAQNAMREHLRIAEEHVNIMLQSQRQTDSAGQ
ncbi:MAG: FadR family transcriptional regulator [Ignavibacteria bacterium]|nr:FadR family transcriptional regulator [Ignavibacteria bacterium]